MEGEPLRVPPFNSRPNFVRPPCLPFSAWPCDQGGMPR